MFFVHVSFFVLLAHVLPLTMHSRYAGSDTDQLREYIDTLVKSGRELGAIAKAVHSVYNESYRDECVHRKSNGNIVERPEWKIESVRRHLLFTTNEHGNSTVFDDYVTQTLQVRKFSFKQADKTDPIS